jgi:hypothetical protein
VERTVKLSVSAIAVGGLTIPASVLVRDDLVSD